VDEVERHRGGLAIPWDPGAYLHGEYCGGELNPSLRRSLAVGMDCATPQLAGLSAPPAAAGADWLIAGQCLYFCLYPLQMK